MPDDICSVCRCSMAGESQYLGHHRHNPHCIRHLRQVRDDLVAALEKLCEVYAVGDNPFEPWATAVRAVKKAKGETA